MRFMAPTLYPGKMGSGVSRKAGWVDLIAAFDAVIITVPSRNQTTVVQLVA
jgi:hypothetical protein